MIINKINVVIIFIDKKFKFKNQNHRNSKMLYSGINYLKIWLDSEKSDGKVMIL